MIYWRYHRFADVQIRLVKKGKLGDKCEMSLHSFWGEVEELGWLR